MPGDGSHFLTLRGKGIRRLRVVIWFFTLAAAYAYPGTLWIRKRPAKGTNQPWVLQYEGAYVDNYYRLLTFRGDGGWQEEITTDQEVIRK